MPHFGGARRAGRRGHSSDKSSQPLQAEPTRLDAHEAYAAEVAARGLAAALGKKKLGSRKRQATDSVPGVLTDPSLVDPIGTRFARKREKKYAPVVQAGGAKQTEGAPGISMESMLLHSKIRDVVSKDGGEEMDKGGLTPSFLFTLQATLAVFFADPANSFTVDFLQTLLSIFACVLYVLSTNALQQQESLPSWMVGIEWFLFGIFSLDYIARLIAAQDWLEHVFKSSSVIDFLSILPILSLVIPKNAVAFGFVRMLRALRLIRILRSYRALGDSRSSMSDDEQSHAAAEKSLKRQILFLALTIISFVFITAGIVHSLEQAIPGSFTRSDLPPECDLDVFREQEVPQYLWPSVCHFDFLTAVYFSVVSFTTVGYGDVIPVTGLAKAVTIVMICVLFILIPTETSKLAELLSQRTPYSKAFERAPEGHVVVCGDVTAASAGRILRELFHEDHGTQNHKRVVFLLPTIPSGQWITVLHNPHNESTVQYVLGSPLSVADLRRAAVPAASAVFVFTNAARDGSNEEAFAADASALLTARAIRDMAPRTPILLQLLRRDSVERNAWARSDLVVCHQSLRMNLLAMNVLYPGMAPFLSNLFNSFGEVEGNEYIMGAGAPLRPGDEADAETEGFIEGHDLGVDSTKWTGLDTEDKVDALRGARDEARDRSRAWRSEYAEGMRQELYAVPISPVFVARSFDDVAMLANRLYGVTLFAVETQRSLHQREEEPTVGGDGHLLTAVPVAGASKEVGKFLDEDIKRRRQKEEKKKRSGSVSVSIVGSESRASVESGSVRGRSATVGSIPLARPPGELQRSASQRITSDGVGSRERARSIPELTRFSSERGLASISTTAPSSSPPLFPSTGTSSGAPLAQPPTVSEKEIEAAREAVRSAEAAAMEGEKTAEDLEEEQRAAAEVREPPALMLLFNPRSYFFRSGDRAVVLADDFESAAKLTQHGLAKLTVIGEASDSEDEEINRLIAAARAHRARRERKEMERRKRRIEKEKRRRRKRRMKRKAEARRREAGVVEGVVAASSQSSDDAISEMDTPPFQPMRTPSGTGPPQPSPRDRLRKSVAKALARKGSEHAIPRDYSEESRVKSTYVGPSGAPMRLPTFYNARAAAGRSPSHGESAKRGGSGGGSGSGDVGGEGDDYDDYDDDDDHDATEMHRSGGTRTTTSGHEIPPGNVGDDEYEEGYESHEVIEDEADATQSRVLRHSKHSLEARRKVLRKKAKLRRKKSRWTLDEKRGRKKASGVREKQLEELWMEDGDVHSDASEELQQRLDRLVWVPPKPSQSKLKDPFRARFIPSVPYPRPAGSSKGKSLPQPVRELPSWVQNHVLVMGELNGIHEFVNAFRGASAAAIVALAPAGWLLPSAGTSAAEDWNMACQHHGNLWYVSGSPMRRIDLNRAGLSRAASVVVLAAQAGHGFAGVVGDASMGRTASDLSAIFTATAVLTRTEFGLSVAQSGGTREGNEASAVGWTGAVGGRAGMKQRQAGSKALQLNVKPRVTVELLEDTSVRFLHSTLQHPSVAERQASVRAAVMRWRAAMMQRAADPQEARRRTPMITQDMDSEVTRFRHALDLAQEEAGMGNPGVLEANTGISKIVEEESPSRLIEKMPPRLRPHFASGVCYLASTLDSLLCQLYYNPLILRVLEKLLRGAASTAPPQPLPKEVRQALLNSGGRVVHSVAGSAVGLSDVDVGVEDVDVERRSDMLSDAEEKVEQPEFAPWRSYADLSSTEAAGMIGIPVERSPTHSSSSTRQRTSSPQHHSSRKKKQSRRASTSGPTFYKENGFFRQLAVPPPFHGRRYHSLFCTLLSEHRILSLAIYRCPEALGAPMPYVVTNPSPTLRLHRNDRLFVLCGADHIAPPPVAPFVPEEHATASAAAPSPTHGRGDAGSFGGGSRSGSGIGMMHSDPSSPTPIGSPPHLTPGSTPKKPPSRRAVRIDSKPRMGKPRGEKDVVGVDDASKGEAGMVRQGSLGLSETGVPVMRLGEDEDDYDSVSTDDDDDDDEHGRGYVPRSTASIHSDSHHSMKHITSAGSGDGGDGKRTADKSEYVSRRPSELQPPVYEDISSITHVSHPRGVRGRGSGLRGTASRGRMEAGGKVAPMGAAGVSTTAAGRRRHFAPMLNAAAKKHPSPPDN